MTQSTRKEFNPLRLNNKEMDKEEIIRYILEHPFWPKEIGTREFYERIQDDDDGTGKGRLRVLFGDDGDAWVCIPDSRDGIRFRTYGGGGKSLRTRAALLILAEAIRLDNEELPQREKR